MIRLHIESEKYEPGKLAEVTKKLKKIGFAVFIYSNKVDSNTDTHVHCGFCGTMIHANTWLDHRRVCRQEAG